MLGEAGMGPNRVMTNRGASGIDGPIATAFGFSQCSDEPTTPLLGDPAHCTIQQPGPARQ